MKWKRSITLVELIIAISIIGVMVITVSNIGILFYRMKKEILDTQQLFVQGHVATAAIFERVLRAANIGNVVYTISPDGRSLSYKRPSGEMETIWLQDGNIMYNDGNFDKVLLRNVSNLRFVQDYQSRLAVDLTLENDENIRMAVVPRNAFTPQSIIN